MGKPFISLITLEKVDGWDAEIKKVTGLSIDDLNQRNMVEYHRDEILKCINSNEKGEILLTGLETNTIRILKRYNALKSARKRGKSQYRLTPRAAQILNL